MQMKKIVVLGLMLATCFFVAAEEPIQVGFWFDCPRSTSHGVVEGVKIGIPVCAGQGWVKGAELALCCAGTDKVKGLQGTLIGVNMADHMTGVQLAFVNMAKRTLKGVQLGAVNLSEDDGFQLGFLNVSQNNSKFQFGFLNFNKNGWLPVMIFVNFGRDTFR